MYITPTPNPSGAYPSPQKHKAPGLIPLTDEQAAMVVQYNGFVTITPETDEAGAVSYKVEPNTEAWEAWKATPVPEPEVSAPLDQRVAELEANSQELYEALDMILTGVTE